MAYVNHTYKSIKQKHNKRNVKKIGLMDNGVNEKGGVKETVSFVSKWKIIKLTEIIDAK